MQQPELDLRRDFRLARLAASDVAGRSDVFVDLESRLLRHEEYYPGIRVWLADKVSNGILDGSRQAFVGYYNDLPVSTAVVRVGRDSKFCHLSLSPDLRNRGLGEIFFALMINAIRPVAKSVHFTLPESLWADQHVFFESFGFGEAAPCDRQYRLFEDELRCQAAFPKVWSALVAKLPKLLVGCSSPSYPIPDLVLAIQARFAEKILAGTKSVEIRRKFSTKWAGARLALYASRPTRALVGEVSIASVEKGAPAQIWSQYGDRVDCSYEEYRAYARDCEQVSALVLNRPRPYGVPLDLDEARRIARGSLSAPQSHCVVGLDDAWSIPVATSVLANHPGLAGSVLSGSVLSGSVLSGSVLSGTVPFERASSALQ